MQQIFFEHFNTHSVNIPFNNVSFVTAKLSAFFPPLYLSRDQLSGNSRVLKEFFNSNLLVLIYFSRLMLRIITSLAERSVSINLIQSFLLFSSYFVSLAASPSKLIESEVPLALQCWFHIQNELLYPLETNQIHPLRKFRHTAINDRTDHGEETCLLLSKQKRLFQWAVQSLATIPKHALFNSNFCYNTEFLRQFEHTTAHEHQD